MTDGPPDVQLVLILEDDDAVRRAIERMLVRLGYRVLSAPSVATALDLCDMHDGPIDLLLSDIVLPQSDGVRAAEAITARHPAMKVLYMSGDSEPAVLRESVGKRPEFIAKPFGSDELQSKIRDVLAG